MTDTHYGQKYEEFRALIRAFLGEHWKPEGVADRKAYERAFREHATDQGFLYRAIPRRYGGGEQPADVYKGQIIREEFERVRAPREVRGNGMMMLVPTLLAHGTEWQKERFIAPTVRGDCVWAQGYSEPNAGSDLASLQTKAVLNGDRWVINGQKVWTTDAMSADYMFALVRTEPDAPKHRGISYLLLDMRQPGVEVRPLKQITGTSEFNEVFLTDAVTPADWIVGARGEGWKISRTTLHFERNAVGAADGSTSLFEKLVELARKTKMGHGGAAIEDPVIRDHLGRLEGFVLAHRAAGLAALDSDAAGRPSGGIGLMNKQISTNIAQEAAVIAQKIMGDEAMLAPVFARGHKPGPERWTNQFFNSIAAAIGGGTSNIHRNIVAERLLGLPREHQGEG